LCQVVGFDFLYANMAVALARLSFWQMGFWVARYIPQSVHPFHIADSSEPLGDTWIAAVRGIQGKREQVESHEHPSPTNSFHLIHMGKLWACRST